MQHLDNQLPAATSDRPAPPGRSVRGRHLRRGARGAALVEAVFVMPVLMMLVFGMITYGMALSQGNSIENAAREAARFGSTRPVGTLDTWLDEVTEVAVAASTGELDGSASDRWICVALVGTGNDRHKITAGASDVTRSSGGCPESSATAAAEVSCPSTMPCVQVVLERSAKLEAVAFQRTITIGGSAVTTFERET